MRMARRKDFSITFFCGHRGWTSLPDGPGWTMAVEQVRREAAKGYCKACCRLNDSERPARPQ